jgi:hypothetical protein
MRGLASMTGFTEKASPLALTRFEAGVFLVDHVGPATAADDAAIFVALLERAERVANFHGG